jgi:hypothetical protein
VGSNAVDGGYLNPTAYVYQSRGQSVNGAMREVKSWRLETGNWKLEAGNWGWGSFTTKARRARRGKCGIRSLERVRTHRTGGRTSSAAASDKTKRHPSRLRLARRASPCLWARGLATRATRETQGGAKLSGRAASVWSARGKRYPARRRFGARDGSPWRCARPASPLPWHGPKEMYAGSFLKGRPWPPGGVSSKS